MVQVRSLAEEDDEVFTGDISIDEVRCCIMCFIMCILGAFGRRG